MQTKLPPFFKRSPEGAEADAILRSCVHCGFCNATCPTYEELRDERDGPRGRIYLIKQLLEEGKATAQTRTHLDRCLSCRSCETTCPSGVEFGRLLDLGRNIIEQQQSRPWIEQLFRKCLRLVLPFKNRFKFVLRLAQLIYPMLPVTLREKIPPKRLSSNWPQKKHQRVMLVLSGCVQPGSTPNTNPAAARVLDRLGISLLEITKDSCCGAMSYHLSAQEEAKGFMRANIDVWWPMIERGAEAIVMTASGCGTTVKDYGYILKDDPAYAEKAKRVSELTRDLSEILIDEDLSVLKIDGANAIGSNLGNEEQEKIAVHCPCSLQHGQKLPTNIDVILNKVGFNLVQTEDKHFCCGSAGTYSMLQSTLSQTLLDNKIKALTSKNPDQIVTANVGCQLHLESKSTIPVSHWVELLDKNSVRLNE